MMTRVLLAEFSKSTGRTDIRVRLYRETVGYVYERLLREIDGTSEIDTTMVLPFTGLTSLRQFIGADPYSDMLLAENERLLLLLQEEAHNDHAVAT